MNEMNGLDGINKTHERLGMFVMKFGYISQGPGDVAHRTNDHRIARSGAVARAEGGEELTRHPHLPLSHKEVHQR